MRGAYRQTHRTQIVEPLFDYARLHILDDTHYVVHGRVGECDLESAVHRAAYYRAVLQNGRRRLSVSLYQTGNAELRAAEVPHDHHQRIGHIGREQLPEDRLAGCRRGFAVIVGAERRAVVPEPVGVAVMRRIVIAFAQCIEMLFDLLLRFDVIGVCEELAAELPVYGLGFAFDGQITVLLCIHGASDDRFEHALPAYALEQTLRVSRVLAARSTAIRRRPCRRCDPREPVRSIASRPSSGGCRPS